MSWHEEEVTGYLAEGVRRGHWEESRTTLPTRGYSSLETRGWHDRETKF